MDLHAQLDEEAGPPFNEIVVDGVGNAFVNGGAGQVLRVSSAGEVTEIADGLRWPNGMALVDDDRTLIVADSHAEALLAFDVSGDGAATRRRVWADLDSAPDGICIDREGAVWVASVPGESCVRVREGGEVLNTVPVDRGCFACMLGGGDGRTLFIAAARWRGMEGAVSDGPGTTGRLLAVPGQPAPRAARP